MTNNLVLIDKAETEEGIVEVFDNGLLISTIREGAYIDVPYIQKGKERLLALGLGRKFYVLSRGTGFYRVSKEARKLSASKEFATHLGAVAVMVNHVSVRFVLDMYLKIDKPVTPTRAFTDEKLALKWLEEKRIQHNSRSSVDHNAA
jgi:hypothetical protein